ncbi:hypothetical protein F53441_7266 [Fusarium austroafricanum]|uniref:Uncharacterized protein n=1 Tax=Fusarium austroafricanum TaxID=2364996 RepID=A0A8H4KFJ3_9HYPO|nr:hypothetical protein F53441_7266 [Fusarium austroafricanum]
MAFPLFQIQVEAAATQEQHQIHASSAFTSFAMVDFLLTDLKESYRNFVEHPQQTLRRFEYGHVLNEVYAEIHKHHSEKLTANGSCTALAIRVAQKLNADFGNGVDFKIYDTEHHRFARYVRTNVVVDSSNKKGASVVVPGQIKNISTEKALAQCLKDVAKNTTLVTYFRVVKMEEDSPVGRFLGFIQ